MTFGWKKFVFGSNGPDELTGTSGSDFVVALGGNDTITTGAGRDKVFAGSGDDIISGGSGNDYIFGGRGFDTARYEGGIGDYQIMQSGSWFGAGTTTVESVSGSVTDAGKDRLFSVEALYFAGDDYTLFLDGRNNSVLAGDDAVETSEDDALVIPVADLLANDRDFDGDSLILTGTDATSTAGATISLVAGQITYDPGTLFDSLAEGDTATDSFSYTVDDGRGGVDTATVTVTVTGVNDAPVLTAPDAVSMDENTIIVPAAISASDVDGPAPTFSLTGADAALFQINASSGEIRFADAPDFEMPQDQDADNVYDVTVVATDDLGAIDSQQLAITVNDVVETPPLDARLNEFHYDNAGSDEGEFIEVRVEAGGDVSALVVELYNGRNGAVYNTLNVADGTMTSDGTYDYYVLNLPANGLQNGSPDGIALSNQNTLIEFLSYEGTFEGVGGTADGVTSSDIGVAETSSTAVGQSLQRNEDGTWRAPEDNTAGASNDPASARLNEFHYDNAGADQGEFIEVRLASGADVAGLTVELYNGSNGTVYNTLNVADGTMTSDGNFDYYVLNLPANGLQNGSPDGIALVDGGSLVEFLSYEGTLTGVGGAADGITSTDIGVAETGSTPVGQSLQRNEDGTWRAPEANTAGAANDGTVQPPESRLISEIQGNGDASALVGTAVTVSAVVTHVSANGYFLQEEDADADGDATTSEGLFVFTGNSISVSIGDQVTISGDVAEFFGMTQITNVTSEVINASNVTLPTASQILLSPDAAADFEAVEGMLVTVSSGTPDPLTVIENFNLDRFGEITISAGTQTQPTQLFDAQTEAAQIDALQEANANNRLLLDDDNGAQNPDSFAFIPGGTGDNGNGFLDSGDDFGDTGSTLRLGAELTADVQGVLNFAFGDYRLIVTEQLQVDEATNSGARDLAPDAVGGTLQVASVNALNYFSTIDGTGTSGPNGLQPRGADNADELVRQTDALVANLLGTGAEVLAMQELENNGFGPSSAISTLVDALNAEADPGGATTPFAFVDPTGGVGDGFIGTDAITTGIVYDTRAVTLVNADFYVFDEASAATTFALAEVLNAVVPAGDQVADVSRNRPTVVATFEDNLTGETFTVASSHFKSKGDSNLQDLADAAQAYLDNGGTEITQADIDALVADPNFDQGDGQGFWNQVRLDAATELADWIANDYGGTGVQDYLLLGDMNAYAKEDPVQHLADDAGLVDLIDTYIGQDQAYSFVFDGQRGTLDQGFASSGLADNVTGATEWHINADEPDLLNYDNSFKNPDFYNPGVFASSDHDPLIIGLDFSNELLLI